MVPTGYPHRIQEGVAPALLSLPQSCEEPQRKAWGLGWPPGSQPNPLLMSGQPEGLSPWPQTYNPGNPSQAKRGGQGGPDAFARTFPLLGTPTYPPNATLIRPTQGPVCAETHLSDACLGLPQTHSWALTICSSPGPTWGWAGETITADLE